MPSAGRASFLPPWIATPSRAACTIPMLLMALTAPVGAQSVVHVHVDANKVRRGDGSACTSATTTVTTKHGTATGIPQDTIYVEIYKIQSDTQPSAALDESLELRLDYREIGLVATDSATQRFPAGLAGLRDARLSFWRPNNTVPICVMEPVPTPVSFAQPKAFTTHTDIIATGDVSNALRTGADNASSTGSLGFHHVSFPVGGRRRGHFPLPSFRNRFASFPKYTVDGEDLRAIISVASTVDSVTGSGGNFAQAVLLPAIGSTGGFKSVDLEYFPFHVYGQNQEFGPAFRLAASQSRWSPTQPGTATADDVVFPATNAILVAFDARLRWVAINRISATDDNSLSFTIDAGYIRRSVDGDIVASANKSKLYAALGDSSRTHFGGWAAGTYLRLRQVTAYADFQCLSCGVLRWKPFGKKSNSPIQNLEGLQPIIGFRFEAPFFTVPD